MTGSTARNVRRFTREEPLAVAIAVAAAAAYSVLAWFVYLRFEHGYDLAIFDQAVWRLSRFDAPETTLVVDDAARRIPLDTIWGDHFHPVIVLLAPLYWVWDDARALLVAQAVLVAASAIPVYLFARLRLPRVAAYLVLLAYVAYWALHTGVSFGFHEVAFAPLLIALAIYLAASGRYGAALVACAALLLVKEDMAVAVIAFGVYLLVLRRPREAAIAIGGAAAWFVVATAVVIPYFAGGDRGFRHFKYAQFGDSPAEAIATAVRDPTLLLVVATDPPEKAQLVLFLLAPFAFFALYSPIALVALPLIAERVLASKAAFWSPHLHYSLAVAPVVAMAAADGVANVLRGLGVRRRFAAAAVAATAVMLVASVATAKNYAGQRLFESALYRETADGRDAAAAVARVPRHDDSVATQVDLVARLSQRSEIYLLAADAPTTRWIVWRPLGGKFASPSQDEEARRVVAARRGRYALVFRRGEYEVLRLR